MDIFEQILLSLSKDPNIREEADDTSLVSEKNPLANLNRCFVNFSERIKGKRILDFGCGCGFQSRALQQLGASLVVGLDTNENTITKARELSTNTNLVFLQKLEQELIGTFDIVISQNSMEHFNNPESTINQMLDCLKIGGELLITFGPPWFAPYGSHCNFISNIPWLNVLFPEKTVLKVRARYRSDGATRYEEVESGLNKMSIKKFESLIHKLNTKVTYLKYDCVKGLDFLQYIPLLRELFINNVVCIIEKK